MSEEANNNAGGNEGGNQGAEQFPKWMSSLPDAYKQDSTLAQFKEGLPYDKVVNLLKAESSMVQIPGEDATDEVKKAFYAKLGLPDKPEGYEIKPPADLPEGLTFDENGLNTFLKFAHDQKFSKAQTQSLFNWYVDLAKNGHALSAQKQAEAEKAANAEYVKNQTSAVNALKDEWKDKFDGNMAQAVIGFKTFSKDYPDAEKLLDVSITDEKLGNIRLGDHPVFNRLFFNIAQQVLGDGGLSGHGGGAGGSGDPDANVAAQMFPSMQKK